MTLKAAQLAFLLLAGSILPGIPAVSPAGQTPALTVAVAANFMRTMEELKPLFEQQTGLRLETSYSSTGKLYAQIKHGAPFDCFLAADAERPELLFKEGLVEEPFVYARGQAVLWSRRSDLAATSHWQAVVQNPRAERLAVSSPAIAPYGKAAIAALKAAGLWAAVENRLIYAQSVAQAFQFGQQEAVDATFTALSLALSEPGKAGNYWSIPEAPAVVQKGCLLKRTPRPAAARQFLKFLGSPAAKKIIARYGYR